MERSAPSAAATGWTKPPSQDQLQAVACSWLDRMAMIPVQLILLGI
jgi:hypothetical protein